MSTAQPSDTTVHTHTAQAISDFSHNIDGKHFQVGYSADRTKCFIVYKVLLGRKAYHLASIEFDGKSWGQPTPIPAPVSTDETEDVVSIGDNYTVCFDPNNAQRRMIFFAGDGDGIVRMRAREADGTWSAPAHLPVPRGKTAVAYRYTKLAVSTDQNNIYLYYFTDSGDLVETVGSRKNDRYEWKKCPDVSGEALHQGGVSVVHHNGRTDILYRAYDGGVSVATRINLESKWLSQGLIAPDQLVRKSPLALMRHEDGGMTMFYLRIEERVDERVPTIYSLDLVPSNTGPPTRGGISHMRVGRLEPSSNIGVAVISGGGSYLFSVSKLDGENVLVAREPIKGINPTAPASMYVRRWVIPSLLRTDPETRATECATCGATQR